MPEYVMVGITSEGRAEYIQRNTEQVVLLTSAARAVENGNTGGYVAIDVLQIVGHFPIPQPHGQGEKK